MDIIETDVPGKNILLNFRYMTSEKIKIYDLNTQIF